LALLLVCAANGWSAPAAGPPASSARAQAIEQTFRLGDRAVALQQLGQALADAPGDVHLRFLQAVLLAESGRRAEAALLYERMHQDYPELAEPCNNLAVLHAADGALDSARQLLETAVRLAPDYRVAHQNLGDVMVRLAQRAYQRAADGVPPQAPLQRKLALTAELLSPS
jgi:Flp pilus assembly protein TadD